MSIFDDQAGAAMAPKNPFSGGSGKRFGSIVIILAGVAALIASCTTFISVWLQRVPIYCAVSWTSLVSLKAAFWIEPLLDVYEAFTIYAFFQLLINFIGGERALIILMHGRKPVAHLWPLNHCLAKVDISDPHTFLAVKRGILQYTWIKPMLAVATIAMKATNTYQEGYIGVTSGYLWSGLIYNISITICLYALAMFWVCMSVDLKPFRPMPKFISIKGIIFASYWQGLFLSILVWLGAIPDLPGYSPDNLAAAIQDALICFEMPFFALLHWYAFSWQDYADVTISMARMPIRYALRDAFGSVDLIQDAKETFTGSQYEYRQFDAEDDVLAHEESAQRAERIKQGMRYERNGKGKYWIPDPHEATSKTPLLSKLTGERRVSSRSPSPPTSRSDPDYGSTPNGGPADIALDDEDEQLYTSARELEFGDWNYPVITAHHATREDRLYGTPSILTASTNRHLLQATTDNKKRRKSAIQDIQAKHSRTAKGTGKGKDRSKVANESAIQEDNEEEAEREERGRSTIARIPEVFSEVVHKVEEAVGIHTTRSSSKASHRSLLVDLVVEDHVAEEAERVRARKEGSPGWNRHDTKHFVRTYPGSDGEEEEEVRQGNEPDEFDKKGNRAPSGQHNVAAAFDRDEEGEPGEVRGGKEEEMWSKRKYGDDDDKKNAVEGEEQDATDVANDRGERGVANEGEKEGEDERKERRRKESESERSVGESRWTEYPDAEENVWASPRR